MAQIEAAEAMAALAPFVGRWSMAMGLAPGPPDAPSAFVTFAWLPGQLFLIQRWEVDHPDAPDGIAVIGFDEATGGYVQHYFDSRGVARRYQMTVAGDLWTLERRAAEPDFWQRFTGRFDDSRSTIAGHWERSDDGSVWAHDFDLTYTLLMEE